MKSAGKARFAFQPHPTPNPGSVTRTLKRLPSTSALLSLAIAPILASCSSAVPKENHLQPGAMTGIHSLLVVASSKDVKVASDSNLNMSLLGIVFGPPGVGLDWTLTSITDAQRSAQIQPQAPKHTIAQRLGTHFANSLSADGVATSIEQAPAENAPSSPGALSRFGALVRVQLTELQLRPVAQNELSLYIAASAEMVSLKNGIPAARLWSREERLVSQDPHTLDFYRNQGIPALDHMLAKLAKCLADDIAYSK